MVSNLHSLIKEISQKKSKKLKIICNINDVIRPMKSSALYGISDKTISFKEYSKFFWEKRDYENSSGVQRDDKKSKLIKENLKTFEKYTKERNELRKTIPDKEKYKREVAKLEKKYMGNWDYLSNRPFTTIAEDLLKCLKENLIEEIVFGLASWTKRKQNLPSVLNKVRIDEFNESFKKFSNKCFFINGDNEEIKDYWKRAMTVRPDLNLYFRSW